MAYGHFRPPSSSQHERRWLRITRRQALTACFVLGLIVAFGLAGLRVVQERARAIQPGDIKESTVREARR